MGNEPDGLPHLQWRDFRPPCRDRRLRGDDLWFGEHTQNFVTRPATSPFLLAHTAAEVKKLYTGYRGAEYNVRRLMVEPKLAPFIPMFDDALSKYHVDRMRDYADIMDVFSEFEPRNVLDFGGDGSLHARLFPAAKIDFDDLSAGIGGGTSLCDFIFAAQVFEHLSDPLPRLQAISNKLGPGGIELFEVPKQYVGGLREGSCSSGTAVI